MNAPASLQDVGNNKRISECPGAARERKRTRDFRTKRDNVSKAFARFEQFAGANAATQAARAHLEALHFGPSTDVARRAWTVVQEMRRLVESLDVELCALVRFCEMKDA